VLGPDAEHDAALRQKVTDLVSDLNNADFRRRESALNDLIALGGPAARLLLERPRHDLTPEQNTRLESFLAAYQTLTPERVAELRQDADFLIRSFIYSEDPKIRSAAQADLLGKSPEAAHLDPAATREARARAAGKLRERLAGS
jgi:hypothetical protein